MMVRPATRMGLLGHYAFAEIDGQVARLRKEGFDPIDFGVGDPTFPTPAFIVRAASEGLEMHKADGYPSYEGEPEFRRAVTSWMERRFGVALDPDSEVSITVGSKEAIFNVHKAFVNPGDMVISPSPGYPPYSRGATFAEGSNWFYPLTEENGFLPDLDAIPPEVAEKARVFWICQPHVPSGRILDEGRLCAIAAYCTKHEILLCSDEAYIDHYFESAPDSLLQHSRRNVLAFYSFSKRSSMTGYRCGWVAGDREAIGVFRKLKTNIDSGVPRFIQDAAMAALGDEEHVKGFRRGYQDARDRMLAALVKSGLPSCRPQSGLYIWQRAPEGMTGFDLATRLLEPDLALITSPGVWLSEPVSGGMNPGADYIRFALVPPADRIDEAIRRLDRVNF